MPSADLYPQISTIHYEGWLPRSKETYDRFFRHMNDKAAARRKAGSAHIRAVDNFKNTINADREMVELFQQIFLQAATPQNHVCHVPR